MRRKVCLFALLWPLLSLTAYQPAAAQTDAEYLSAINFRFANPGARARGLGGAFVALADDASAAVVNPAGLAYLNDGEFSIEYTSGEDESPAPRVETGVERGPNGRLIQQHPPRRATITSDSEQVSFASYSHPIKKGRFVIGLFYSSLLDTASNGSGGMTSFEIGGATFPSIDDDRFFYPVAIEVQARNRVAGLAAGLRLGNRFSVGASVGVSELEMHAVAQRSFLLLPIEVNSQSSDIDAEQAIFVTVGGLWQVTDRFSLGGSWQLQTEYDMTNRFESDFAADRTFETQFTIPTRWTLGAAYRIRESWVIAVEADRIEYSDLFDNSLEQSFFGASSGDPSFGYGLSDVTEFHLGVEYTRPVGRLAWSFRVGFWRDQTHPPFYTGSDPGRLAWAPKLEEDIDHFTTGLGVDTGRLVFDVAVDSAPDAGTNVLASVVVRFGKLGS